MSNGERDRAREQNRQAWNRLVEKKNIQRTFFIFPEHDALIVLIHKKGINGDRIYGYTAPVIQHLKVGPRNTRYVIAI